MAINGTAYSIDGRHFRFDAPIGDAPMTGGYVRIDTGEGNSYIGQIVDAAPGDDGPTVTTVTGTGAIRAVIEDATVTGSVATAFGSASISPMEASIVGSHFERSLGASAGLDIGTLRRVDGDLPATLKAEGFGRHTFVCGQSGSGKTYTLGVILERLLLETGLRIAVLDPNSDYIRLSEVRGADAMGLSEDDHADLSERYLAAASGVSVHGTRPDQQALQTKFGRLSLRQQALALDIDPIRDAEEYNAFRRIVERMETTDYTLGEVRRRATENFEHGSRNLALRIDNLGVEDLGIWAGEGEPGIIETLPEDWRGVILDLGSLPSAEERSMMAASAVAYFWDKRHERIPTLLVIDEAHNVCPQEPADRFQAMASDHLAAIAGEGRKFGLYLLLVTQRPGKVHVNVLSQCENLVLMRMNSTTDIEHLAATFSHVPAPLIRQASTFGLGEGLAAGRITTDPMLFRTGSRLSVEGGSDIPSDWARAR